ncbi:MAG: branched-chain amino acid ABC transporter permease [Firmicutes bacterium]|nr:branched-chain amino acid ABC transporter permease [Clostridia bacterium]MBR2559119.1 branched-chain amino acid ABC transporter permease [Bacillota bacterium]MBR3053229.1 branched-chain amino acid ABC transporter permease [Bacillota bacterium]MCR4668389.1 branched-chain amino acid ABC transporter permease [Clostridia bacterium]
MNVFLQQLINGLSIGSIYALMAVGYSLVYSILNFSNFAHGSVIMLGAYFGYYAVSLIMPNPILAFIVATIGCGIVAVLLEKLAYRPLRLRNAPSLYFIIAAMGASIFLENLVIATIGPNFKTYPAFFKNPSISINDGALMISKIDILMFIIAAVSLLLLVLILEKTRIGLGIRGTSYSTKAATLMGVNVDRVIFTIFLLGGILAGLAGTLYGVRYKVYPQMGVITNKSFVAAVFGGLGSLPGAVIGSLLLGVIETFGSSYIASQYRDLIAYVLLVIVLVVKPSGLMGKMTEDKA